MGVKIEKYYFVTYKNDAGAQSCRGGFIALAPDVVKALALGRSLKGGYMSGVRYPNTWRTEVVRVALRAEELRAFYVCYRYFVAGAPPFDDCLCHPDFVDFVRSVCAEIGRPFIK